MPSRRKSPGKKEGTKGPVRSVPRKTPAARAPRKTPALTRKLKSIVETEVPVLTETPFQIPPAPQPQAFDHDRRELPDDYGDNQIYLLVRDPYWIYSYWEVQKDHQEKVLTKVGGSWDGVSSVLRVFDITGGTNNPPYFDIALQNMAKCWYINTHPNHAYVVEIGLLHRDGRFACLARSNEVRTPRAGMSEVIDEQWMAVDWDKMYALSGGFQVGKSSAELRKLMEERLKGAITSGSGAGAVSSMASPVRIKKRGFSFWLECELIIYGGTEPDAAVTMQGRPVKLRPDGTFTLRYALPDGKFIFDCHAHSADGVEERVITPIVGRATERPAPIFKKGQKK